MSKIIIFGAGGRLGRLAIQEAQGRGHQITAAVRDPARHEDLATAAVRVARADATDAESVAAVSAGHDAAIASLYQDVVPHDVFYADATQGLLDGLARSAVGRLLVVGVAANLETEQGVRIMDDPGFPAEHRPFALGHTVALHLLRASRSPVDWLMLTPPIRFTADAPRTGRYRCGGDRVLAESLSYADFAVALIDEIETPTQHRTRIAVAD